MKIEELTINNLKTYFLYYPGAQSNSTQIWFRAGSSLESKSDLGIAHFLEHMFFKGTKKRPGSKIAKEIESFGGDVNAFTSFDYTCYYINSPKDYLNKSIEILLDMVSNPTFDNKELLPERDVVYEEYKRSIDNPSHFHFHNIQRKSFSKGYSHPILGNPKSIQSFTRKQIVNFRKKHYNTSNASLIIAGDIQHIEKSKKIISQYKLPSGPKSKFNKFSIKKGKENIFINKKDVNQTTVSILINAPAYSEKTAISEDLAINCLAYGETSYLHKKLVKETGLASASGGSTMFMNNGGAHFLKIVCPTDKIQKTLLEFTKVISNLLKKGLNEEDLQKIKNQYIASKIYEQETVDSLAFSLGHGFAQDGNIHSDKEFVQRIKEATLEEVNSALFRVFSHDHQIHAQIPLDMKETKLKTTLGKFSKDLKKIKNIKEKSAKKTKQLSKFDSQIKEIALKKGIKLLYRYNPMIPTFSMHAYLKGGLSTEDQRTAGTHYQIAKNLTYGHQTKNYNDLKLDLGMKASNLSGFSGKNAYGLTMHGLSEHFNDLSEDFFQTLLKPSFPEYYLDIEKELLNRYFEDIKTNAIKQCFSKFQEMVFKGTKYEMQVTGPQKNLNSFNSTVLQKTHSHNLRNKEILITYCGDKKLNEIKKLCNSFLVDLEEREINKFKPFKKNKLKNESVHIEFDREQTQIFIGQTAFHLGQSEDVYLKMLTHYLSGQSSELFVDVRDKKGLCYSCQPIHHTALQAGYWGIYIGTSFEKTQKAIEAIENLLKKIAKNGLSQSEVIRIKKMITGSLQLQLQSNEDYANFYSIPYLHNCGIDFEHERIEAIKKVNKDNFNKFLKKFLSQPRLIVKAGKKS